MKGDVISFSYSFFRTNIKITFLFPVPNVQNEGKSRGGDDEPSREEDEEGRVVAGELELGLLPVAKVAVDLLGRGQQVDHLPERELKVHLPAIRRKRK